MPSSGSLPILYSFRRCPYAMRARLAIQVSGTQCELREVVLRDKPAEMLAVSPKGTVPVLIDTTREVIDESLDIMLWALNKNDPQNWLEPQQTDLNSMLKLIAEFDRRFKPQLDRYKYSNRFEGADANRARELAYQYLASVTDKLASQEYLFSRSASLADMALAPFVRQFANTDRDWFDSFASTGLLQWLNRILESELFAATMRKYPQWHAPDSGELFPA